MRGMHTTNVRRARVLVILLTILALVAAACGEDETVTSDAGTAVSAVADSGEIEGEFLVSGSSTVFPIVLEQAEVFGAENSGVAIAVEGPGSGDGAKKFCDGEVPITNASRLLKDEEVEICDALESETNRQAIRRAHRISLLQCGFQQIETSTLFDVEFCGA